MLILAIDPSVNNVGIALYDTKTKQLESNCFKPKRNQDTPIIQVTSQITDFLQKKKRPDVLIVEYPQWEASTRGLIAMQQGYTLDLAFICGFIAGAYPKLSPSSILTPTPREWKGQTPKAGTECRVRRAFNLSSNKISEHEFDAMGLILWFLSSVET